MYERKTNIEIKDINHIIRLAKILHNWNSKVTVKDLALEIIDKKILEFSEYDYATYGLAMYWKRVKLGIIETLNK